MVCLPGSTDPVTVAEQHMRNSDRPAGHVESPVPSNGHAGFGRRDEETDQSKDRHRASSRPHYQWVYAQPVSTLARELITLRTGRRARRGGRRPPPAPRIREPRYIEQRPAEADARAVPGHWEGDLVIGKDGKSAVATLVERVSRFLILVPLTGRDALTVGEAVIAAVDGLPAAIKRSLTWDCGTEMARHATITATGLPVYFAHPHSGATDVPVGASP